MFKQLIYVTKDNSYYYYDIIDSQFRKSISIRYDFNYKLDSVANRTRAMIKAYQPTKLPIAKNIVLYYKQYYGNLAGTYTTDIKYTADALDTFYPELQFKSKYYPCILYHLNKLKYQTHV